MNASAPDGTIFLTAYASLSISPSYGDKHIKGWFLWRDKEVIKAGTELPSGFHHLCTDQYFMVVFADLGCLYEGQAMKVDEVTGKIWSLQSDKLLDNTLSFISSQQLTCRSFARKTMPSSSTQWVRRHLKSFRLDHLVNWRWSSTKDMVGLKTRAMNARCFCGMLRKGVKCMHCAVKQDELFSHSIHWTYLKPLGYPLLQRLNSRIQ